MHSTVIFVLRGYKAINEALLHRSPNSDLMKDMKKTYMELSDLTHCFNQVMGWPLLMIYLDCLLELQLFFTFVIKDHFVWGDTHYALTKSIVFICVGYMLLSMVSNLFLI